MIVAVPQSVRALIEDIWNKPMLDTSPGIARNIAWMDILRCLHNDVLRIEDERITTQTKAGSFVVGTFRIGVIAQSLYEMSEMHTEAAIIEDWFRGETGISDVCERCCSVKDISSVQAMTCYVKTGSEDPNKPLMLCSSCAEQYKDYWAEKWRDYYDGLVI